MLRNYCKIAWRNLLRNKTNSLINIGGLAIGISCVVFIALYVQDDLGYDKGFKKGDRIYQVLLEGNFGGQQFRTSNTPPPVGMAMQTEIPEVEASTRIYRFGNEVVRNPSTGQGARVFTEKNVWAVDSNFLQVFDYAFQEGDAASCLKKFHSLVVTEKTARKYFGSKPAIGQSLILDPYESPFVVTGVLKDLPSNSSLQFDILLSTQDSPPVKRFSWSWVWCNMTTYVVLNEKAATDPGLLQRLDAKFPAIVRKDAPGAFARIGQPFDEFIKKGGKWDFHLQPLGDIHLHSADIGTPLTNLGNIKYVYIFSIIAVFIIVLACINFMNLSTAQAIRRTREVGVRKVLGSMKWQLIGQFMAEAFLYTIIAAGISLLLVSMLMASFNQLAGKELHFGDLFRHGIWAFILLLTAFTGLLAGSYPAFYLTSFQPIEVLKGAGLFSKRMGHQFIRNGLVVFQFTVSIALIICTMIVFRQLNYMQNKDMGLKKDNVLIIPNVEKLEGNMETLRQQISEIPGVQYASVSAGTPADGSGDFTDFYVPLTTGVKEPLAKDVTLTSYMVDEHFVPALHLQLIKGRNFSKAYNDSASIIVNEATVRHIGWKDPIGKVIRYPGNNDKLFTVIGVARDFNLNSLRYTVDPFALFYTTSKTYHANSVSIIASIDSRQTGEIVQAAERKWKAFDARVPFDYSFLDKDYEALYHSEQRLGNVFSTFTLLSILVACLGLFGLSVYTAERRMKEIGIRKILGASVQGVVALLSREFLKLVIISAIISFPIAWWAMTKWLDDFAYRVPMNASVFVIAGLLAIVIALLTVSFQAIRAATRNPARSLKVE
ncbi:MAG TPA: ABC transporter permease [Puia sp.]|nr:ABC transporter permease [Puia sp.]